MNISKRKAKRVLDEIYQIAYNATLTGALRDGARGLLLTYNQIRDYAVKKGWIDEDFIADLSVNELRMAEVGCAAKLFSALLEDEFDENGFKVKGEETGGEENEE